jgi:hypothetical protein
VGCCLDQLGYKILNDIIWVKPNPPPNLSCRYFTHATETIIWAGQNKKCRHKFNYPLMKRINGGKQMTSVWNIQAPRKDEKMFGRHPTQKPIALLERIISACTDEGDRILDPFCGSGTTGIAAARMNRVFSGLEQEDSYIGIAMLRFDGVPQADCPQRILDVVEAHAGPGTSLAPINTGLGLTERQLQYYRQAGAILGLLQRTHGGWTVTELGRECSRLESSCKRLFLARQILAAPIVKAAVGAIRKRRDSEGQRRAIEELLLRATALGQATCSRRAHTLISWIQWAEGRVSEGPVSSSPKEEDDSSITENL